MQEPGAYFSYNALICSQLLNPLKRLPVMHSSAAAIVCNYSSRNKNDKKAACLKLFKTILNELSVLQQSIRRYIGKSLIT